MKSIRFRCRGETTRELAVLREAQGKLKDLTEKNAAKLKKEILEMGFTAPVNVWENAGVCHILDGHQRVRVLNLLRAEGYEIPRVPVNLIEAKDLRDAKRLILGMASQYGSVQSDGLYEFMSEIDGLDIEDIWENIRFPEIPSGKFAAEFFEQEVGEAEEKTGEIAIKETAIKTGDIIDLGEHRLICGDCTKPETLAALLGEERVDLLTTDPPYGVNNEAKNAYLNTFGDGERNRGHIENDAETPSDMNKLWQAAFSACRDVAKDSCAYYITGPQGGDLLLLLLLAVKDSGWQLKHMLVWGKNEQVMGRCDYHYQHEPILYGWNKTRKWYGGTAETSLWAIDKPHQSKLHPTMKPIELYRKQLTNSSRKGDVVLDPFAGSGSSLMAAQMLKRKWRGVEIDPLYCETICQRWEILTGEKRGPECGARFVPKRGRG